MAVLIISYLGCCARCQAFFTRWWNEQSPEKQARVRQLVADEQLVFTYVLGPDEQEDLTLFYSCRGAGDVWCLL